jgi:hypothetical protein
MRTIKYILGFIIVIFFVLISMSEINSQSNNLKDRFFIGPMSHFFDLHLRTTEHIKWYDSLSYNMMQSYCAHLDTIDPWYQQIGQKDGGFFEDLSNYGSYIAGVMQQWRNLSSQNSLIFEREKILRPAYGQRNTYEADSAGNANHWSSVFPGHGFDSSQTGQDYSESWMNENVSGRSCLVGRDNPGLMVYGLHENCEQVNITDTVPDDANSSGWGRLFSDIKELKYQNRWYIKPRMRINPDSALLHLQDVIVKIYVKRFDGNLLDSFAIKCINFFDSNFTYDGRYLERFYRMEDNNHDTSFSVLATALAGGKNGQPDINSKVDYQIYWTGKVDVRLDYVRVDDSWAHYLFKDTWTNGQPYPDYNQWRFRKRIFEEVNAFNITNNGLGYFWVDEVQYSNIPCIGEVNRLVKEYSGNKLSVIFITDPNAFLGRSGMRNMRDSAWSKKVFDASFAFMQKCGALTDIMVTQWFPAFYWVKYPGNLNITPVDTLEAIQFFTPSISADDYSRDDSWWGYQYSINKMLFQHKYYINKAKELGLNFATINQINSDESNIQVGNPDWGLREPTNEEISMIMFTSLAYGSKELLEFSYTTSRQKYDTSNHHGRYNFGLTTPGPNYDGKRVFNYYGQRK